MTAAEQTTRPSSPGSDASGRSVVLVGSGAAFLAFLDVTIVNVAFPDIRADFSSPSLASLSWVITAYGVMFAALLAPSGTIADALGRRRVFALGVGAFGAASLAAGLAPDLGWLIAARAVQGAAAAAMLPTSLAIVLAHAPAELRSKALGIWAASGALAAAAGPAAGGALVEVLGWRSVFYVNVPIAALICWAALRAVQPDESRRGRVPDLLGVAATAGGIAAAVLAVTQGPEWGWTGAGTGAAAAAAAALLTVALRRSKRSTAPAIPVTLWKLRPFAWANAASALYGAALYAWMLLGVLFLVAIWRYSALQAGLAMSTGALAAAVGSVAGGRLVRRQGPGRTAAAGGAAMAAVGAVLWGVLRTEPAFLAVWIPAGTVAGFGMGLLATALATASSAVPPARFAAATGLSMTARQFGGALGIAGLTALLSARSSDGPAGLAAYQDAYALCALLAAAAGVASLRIKLPIDRR